MTSQQFHDAIKGLGLSVVGAAPYLGISKRQCQRMDAGEIDIPMPVQKLLRLVVRHKIEAQELMDA
jgi:hypothetical protein